MHEIYFGVNEKTEAAIEKYFATLDPGKDLDISMAKCAEECSELIKVCMKYFEHRITDDTIGFSASDFDGVLEEGVDVLFTLYKLFTLMGVSDIELFEMFDMKVKKFIEETTPHG